MSQICKTLVRPFEVALLAPLCVHKRSQLMNKTSIVRSKELLHSEKNKGWGIQPWRNSIGGFYLGFVYILKSILKSVDLKHCAVDIEALGLG